MAICSSSMSPSAEDTAGWCAAAAADAYVLPAGTARALPSASPNAPVTKWNVVATVHLDGWTCMMRQDEDRNVIRGIVSPPAFPVHVRPRPTKGAEHVPPEIQAPRFAKPRAAKSSSTPVCRPSRTRPAGHVRVGHNHWCKSARRCRADGWVLLWTCFRIHQSEMVKAGNANACHFCASVWTPKPLQSPT